MWALVSSNLNQMVVIVKEIVWRFSLIYIDFVFHGGTSHKSDIDAVANLLANTLKSHLCPHVKR